MLYQNAPPASAFLNLGSVGASGFDFVVCNENYFLNFSHCFVTV